MTNPEVLRKTLESGGENLVKGLEHLLDDLERGKGQLQIKMTDPDAFEVGRNIAITPGKVVFQNDLIQLLQYDPTTPDVAKRPVLIMPPWINKYYILDLREKNSFIRWAVSEGQTVFVISWVNPDEKLARKTFEDYMVEGPLAALDAVEKATGEKKINVVGYCLGGTLLAATLAYMAAKKIDRVASATFLTTLVDFAEPGELGVFIDEEQLKSLEARMEEKGYLEGSAMASTFNMLRANDLIWSFVVNNYLLGKEPFPFDLLYWNSDSTRMPAAMHSFYLRKMYQENLLVKPGGITLKKTPIDLTQDQDPGLHPLDQGRSYRALEIDLCGDAPLSRAGRFRARRLRPCRRRRQSAGLGQVSPLGQQEDAEGSRRLAGDRHRAARLLVADMEPLDPAILRRQGAGPPAGRRQAEADRGRARQLRQGPRAVGPTPNPCRKPLYRTLKREREGPIAKQWEGEGRKGDTVGGLRTIEYAIPSPPR